MLILKLIAKDIELGVQDKVGLISQPLLNLFIILELMV